MANDLEQARQQVKPKIRTPRGQGKKGQLRVIGSLECGGPAAAVATAEQLQARIDRVRDWAARKSS